MRKHTAIISVVSALLMTLALPLPAQQQDAHVFYVAPDGDDTNAGTQAAPFATLARARDAVRALKADMGGLIRPVNVLIRGGAYFPDTPLELAADDGGTEACPVTWAAYPGETPLISGGAPITGWAPDENGLWRAEIPRVAAGEWNFRDLYVRRPGETQFERRYRPARGLFVIAGLTDAPHRYPLTHARHRNPQDEFYFHEGDIEQWENLEDVELVAMHDWSSGRLNIESIDFEERIVRFTDYPHYRIGHWYPGGRNPYLVENIKEDLGKPGEWYLDRPTGTVYYHPLEGEDMATLEVVAPRHEHLLLIGGDAEGPQYVEHVAFRGLTFAHSSWEDAPHRYSERYRRQCRQGFVDMPSAIEVRWARHVMFERNTMAHIGSYAIDLAEGCHENRIVGNRIFDCGTGGVKVGIVDRGAQPPVTPTNNRVESNLVSDTGIVHYSGHGIWVGYATATAIRHNTVTRTLYSAVAVGWSHDRSDTTCRDQLIEFNHIHDVMLLLDHGGALYTLGYQPGTVLRGNLIHDTHWTRLHGKIDRPLWSGGGLAFDDGSSGFVIEDNIIYNTPSPPDLAVTSQADRHEVGTNYYGLAPGDEGFPAELAARAGPEPQYRDILDEPARATVPPILIMELPDRLPPLHIRDDFERIPVGGIPARAYVRLEDREPGKGPDAIEVTDETAATGNHSLMVRDPSNLSRIWIPYLSYNPGYSTGVARVAFWVRMEEGAVLDHSWRGHAADREFSVGPQIMSRDGALWIGDDKLLDFPLDRWVQIEITCRLGEPDPGIAGVGLEEFGTWTLRVEAPGEEERVFEGLAVRQDDFRDLRGVYFISLAEAPARFFLDDIDISCEE